MTPRYATTLGGALPGWSELIHDLSHFWVSFPFLLSSLRAQVTFLNWLGRDVFPTENVLFWGLDNIWLHLGGQTPKKLKNGREYAIQAKTTEVKYPLIKNWSTNWHRIFWASLDHQCSFVDGPTTLYYKSNMAADAMLDFR